MIPADPSLVAFFISGLIHLMLLFLLLKSRYFRVPTTQILAVFTVISLGWVVGEGLVRLQQVRLTEGFDLFAVQRISLYTLFILAVVFFYLTRLFEQKAGRGLVWWAASLVILLTVVFLYENPLRLPERIMITPELLLLRQPAAFIILVAGWTLLMGSSIVLTWFSYRAKKSPLHRNRTLYWAAAAILATAGQMLVLFRQPAAGCLVHTLAIGLGSYAQLTHALPDLRAAVRRSASYLAVTSLAVLLYTGGFALILALAKRLPGFLPIVGGVVLALVMAAIAFPLLGVMQRAINRNIKGPNYDPNQILSDYSQAINNIIDLDQLAVAAVSGINEAMEIERGALITVHADHPGDEHSGSIEGNLTLRPLDGSGQAMPEGILPGKSNLAHTLSSGHYPIAQYDIDLLPRYKDLGQNERNWFNSLNMDVYVPVYSKQSWIGLLAVGPKRSGDRYFPEDLVVLQTLADQTAIALENARLYADLKQRNTENERLNLELTGANIELARLDVAKSDFINIASHELRTPLTQILGFNDILSEMIATNTFDAQTGSVMVESVQKAARRLEDIVERMFDLSKLESGTLDLHLETVGVDSVIADALETWTKGIEERELSVNVHGLAKLPLIQADHKRLVQAFSNVIQNAIKSTHDGGQIRITGWVVEPEESGEDQTDQPAPSGSWIEMVVADSGIGIDRDNLERIFIKFYRIGNVLMHSSGETKFKGAGPGLGLAIARGIVEAHGGRMWAESPGCDEVTCPGASFHIRLPVHPKINSSNAPVSA